MGMLIQYSSIQQELVNLSRYQSVTFFSSSQSSISVCSRASPSNRLKNFGPKCYLTDCNPRWHQMSSDTTRDIVADYQTNHCSVSTASVGNPNLGFVALSFNGFNGMSTLLGFSASIDFEGFPL